MEVPGGVDGALVVVCPEEEGCVVFVEIGVAEAQVDSQVVTGVSSVMHLSRERREGVRTAPCTR